MFVVQKMYGQIGGSYLLLGGELCVSEVPSNTANL